MSDLFLHLYVVAVGFTTAGILVSTVQMVTGRPMVFLRQKSLPQNVPNALLAIFIRLFAGPFLLLRNAIRGARIEKRAPHWLALSCFLSVLWSFFSGVFILEIIVRLTNTV